MKNKKTAILLTLFFGFVGIHRFYLGQIFIGIIYILFSWTFIPLIVSIIDLIIFIKMSKEKFNSKYNQKVNKAEKQNKICPICKSRLSIWNTPTFNSGYLLNGEQICTKCFRKSIKADKNFVKNSITYSTNSLKELLENYEIEKQQKREEKRLKDLRYIKREENKRNNRRKQANKVNKKPSKFNNEMSVYQIVSKIESLQDLKLIERKAESFSLKYFNTNKKEYDILSKKYSDAYNLASEKIFKVQFIPNYEIETPLKILQQSYKVVDNKSLLFNEIKNIEKYGVWIEYTGAMLSYGPLNENIEPKPDYWESAIKFRKILESDKSINEKKKKLITLIQSDNEFKENFFENDYEDELNKYLKKQTK